MRDSFEVATEDAIIAATAIVHRLKVVTRNLRYFANLGVDVVDPYRNEFCFTAM